MSRVAVIACTLLVTAVAHGQDSGRTLLLGIGYGVSMSPSAPEYFESYRKALGGTTSAFPPSTGLAATAVLQFLPPWSYILDVRVSTLVADEAAILTAYDSASHTNILVLGTANRWSSQLYPVMAGVRFMPVEGRYQSYILAAAGIVITHMRWDCSPTQSNLGAQTPLAKIVDEIRVAPAIAVGIGVELTFDQFKHRELLRGVFAEARYRWSPAMGGIFTVPQTERAPTSAPVPTSRFDTALSGIELTLGVNLQFVR
jgi:hypothetical protein